MSWKIILGIGMVVITALKGHRMTAADKLYAAEQDRAGLVDHSPARWHWRLLPRPITRRNFFFYWRVRTLISSPGPRLYIGIGIGPVGLYRS
jgi:hypothetical protein